MSGEILFLNRLIAQLLTRVASKKSASILLTYRTNRFGLLADFCWPASYNYCSHVVTRRRFCIRSCSDFCRDTVPSTMYSIETDDGRRRGRAWAREWEPSLWSISAVMARCPSCGGVEVWRGKRHERVRTTRFKRQISTPSRPSPRRSSHRRCHPNARFDRSTRNSNNNNNNNNTAQCVWLYYKVRIVQYVTYVHQESSFPDASVARRTSSCAAQHAASPN